METTEYVRFYWNPEVPKNIREEREEAIHKALMNISFCHEGTVTVNLSGREPLETYFDGEIKCSCGKTRGTVTGKFDGTSLSLKPVED